MQYLLKNKNLENSFKLGKKNLHYITKCFYIYGGFKIAIWELRENQKT